jgi:pyruvate kinase
MKTERMRVRRQTKLCIDLRDSLVDPSRLKRWVDAGADAVMVGCSGAGHDRWVGVAAAVRDLEASAGRPIPFIMDLHESDLVRKFVGDGTIDLLDMIAVSADGGGAAIDAVRDSLGSTREIDLIAKLDSPGCFTDIERVCKAADAVTINMQGLRSLSPCESPVAQKNVVRQCQTAAKPCFVQRDSMRRLAVSPQQEQADVFDLANIVFDHADGILLTADSIAETDVRRSMQTVESILVAAESYLEVIDRPVRVGFGQPPNTAALAYAIRHILKMQEIAAVAVYSITGTTARVISKNWLDTPILAFSPRAVTARRMSLYHGVTSRHVGALADTGELLKTAAAVAKEMEIAFPGDRIIVVSGHPDQTQDQANGFVVETVAE